MPLSISYSFFDLDNPLSSIYFKTLHFMASSNVLDLHGFALILAYNQRRFTACSKIFANKLQVIFFFFYCFFSFFLIIPIYQSIHVYTLVYSHAQKKVKMYSTRGYIKFIKFIFIQPINIIAIFNLLIFVVVVQSILFACVVFVTFSRSERIIREMRQFLDSQNFCLLIR